MRIAQITSNYQPTSLAFRKGINSHVAWLTEGLVKRGHDVHLFASSDSETTGHLHSVSEALVNLDLPEDILRYFMHLNISRAYEYAGKHKLDIIHTHFNLLTSTLFPRISEVPTLISVHLPIDQRIREFAQFFKGERYVSFSLAQRKQAPELNWYANIYHGVDMNLFTYSAEPKGYLLYIGRITEDKGVHLAIEAAKAAGVPLVMAGTSYHGEGYWQKHIEPHIDGVDVRYVGEASLEGKIELYRNARAVLFPTQVSEVFGYVMIEAMACGTPVIGFNNGSVPEIVQDGVTGFVVEDAEGMTEAIKKIDTIDRAKVRNRAEQYFSVEKMITGYERVYKRLLEDTAFHANKKNLRRLKEVVGKFPEQGGIGNGGVVPCSTRSARADADTQ